MSVDEARRMEMLYTVKEAAEVLRCSPGEVYGRCSAGLLRHERHGSRRGKILIPRSAIEEYRQSVTVQARAYGDGKGTGRDPVPRYKPRPKLDHLRV